MKAWSHVCGDQRILWLNIFGESGRVFHFSATDNQRGMLVPHASIRLDLNTQDHLSVALSQLTSPNQRTAPEAFAQFGQLLFRMAMPPEIHDTLLQHSGPIVFATEDLALPWELLHDGTKYLALEHALSRLPPAYSLADRLFGPAPAPATPEEPRALIIADPAGDLPEAVCEAEELLALFDHRHMFCDHLIGPAQCQYFNIMATLLKTPYDIIHFAGHTCYMTEQQTSAILLEGGKRLMAEDICRSLVGSPLVFLNACHSSLLSTQTSAPEHAGPKNVRTMVQAFAHGNRLGRARAVIGSMWWVKDDVARGMAKQFYELLLRGQSVGDSLWRARSSTAKSQKDPALWSCYVLFGDPMIALLPTAAAAPAASTAPGASPQAAAAPAPDREAQKRIAPIVPPGSPPPQAEGRPADKAGPGEPQAADILSELSGGLPWSDNMRIALLGSMAAMVAMNWPSLSTLHLLLGLTYIDKGLVSRALLDRGIDPTLARRTMRNLLKQEGKGSHAVGFSISGNLRDILATAKRIAAEETAAEVTERHVLLAALARPTCSAILILDRLKVRLSELRQQLAMPPAPSPAPSGEAAESRSAALEEHAASDADATASDGQEVTASASDGTALCGRPADPETTQGGANSTEGSVIQGAVVPDLFLPAGDMNLDLFSPECRDLLDTAIEVAVKTHWEEIRSPHLFLALLQSENNRVAPTLEQMGLPTMRLLDAFYQAIGKPPRATINRPRWHREFASDPAMRILRSARAIATAAGHPQVTLQDFIRAVLTDKESFCIKQLLKLGVDIERLIESTR